MFVRRIVIIAVQYHFAAEIDDGLHLDLRRRHRHHDERGNTASCRRERDTLSMIAC